MAFSYIRGSSAHLTLTARLGGGLGRSLQLSQWLEYRHRHRHRHRLDTSLGHKKLTREDRQRERETSQRRGASTIHRVPSGKSTPNVPDP